jgi:hypothetical protein
VTGIGYESLSKNRASEIEVQVKDREGFLLLTVTVSVVVRRTVLSSWQDPGPVARSWA